VALQLSPLALPVSAAAVLGPPASSWAPQACTRLPKVSFRYFFAVAITSLIDINYSAEALDQWFENLQNYEATLEDMAAASLDVNFKEELSAIEQCQYLSPASGVVVDG
jgi:hypothetical protein